MEVPVIAAGIVLALAVAAIAIQWRGRQRRLALLRARWTRPHERTRLMPLIAEYHRVLMTNRRPDASVDDRTWDDLHCDAVFALLDRTESTVGQQVLYHRLRSSPMAEHLDAFEVLVEHLGANDVARERLQIAIGRLCEVYGYHLCSLTYESFEPRRWHILFPLLAGTMLAALMLAPLVPAAFLIAITGTVVHLIIRGLTASRIGATLGVFRQVAPLIGAAEVVTHLEAPGAEPIVGSLRDDIAQLRRLRLYARWAGRDPSSNELLGSLFEYLNLILLLDANALYFASRELRARSATLVRLIAAVGEVDAAVAVASFRAGTTGWTRPRFKPGAGTVFKELCHPLVERPVPNSIQLGPPHGVLLTGANMSGKSTFLRTVGVNVVLAQTINTCLAESYEAPVLHLRSLMGRSDDLIAGKSYYLVEVESIIQAMEASKQETPHLFLFDELFRGTNTVERIAAAQAVLAYLARRERDQTPHLILAATHDGELVELLKGVYAPYHLSDALGPEGLAFEYRVQPGPATTRNAIALLQLNGAPEAVVQQAQDLANALDQTREVEGCVPPMDLPRRPRV